MRLLALLLHRGLLPLVLIGTGCSFLHPTSDYLSEGSDPHGELDGGGPGGPVGFDAKSPDDGGAGDSGEPPEDTSQQSTYFRVHGGSAAERYHSVTMLADGRTALVGYTESIGAGNKDLAVAIVDRAGALVQSRVFGTAGNDQLFSVTAVADGGFFAVGLSRTNAVPFQDRGLIARFDKDASLVWSRTLGGAGEDVLFSGAVTRDGGFVAVGRTTNVGAAESDGWIVKLAAATGAVAWERTLGGPAADDLLSVSVAADGTIYAAGTTASFTAGSTDAIVVAFDAAGTLLRARAIGKANDDRANAVLASSGAVLVAGSTFSFGLGQRDGWLLELTPNLDVTWSKAVGSPQLEDIWGLAATDTRVYAIGSTGSSPAALFAVALDRTSRTSRWMRKLGDVGPTSALWSSLAIGADGSLVLVGAQQPTGKSGDALVARITSTGELRGPCATKITPAETEVTDAEIQSRAITPTVGTAAISGGGATVALTAAAGLAEADPVCKP